MSIGIYISEKYTKQEQKYNIRGVFCRFRHSLTKIQVKIWSYQKDKLLLQQHAK